MVSDSLKQILPQFLLVFIFVQAVVGSLIVSLLTVVLLGLLLNYLRVPPPPMDRVSAVLSCADGEPCVIAHRGAGLDAPENTIAAVRLVRSYIYI